MNILIHEIRNCLKFSFNSIRFSATLFLTTISVDALIVYAINVSDVSETVLFIALILDSIVCLFTGITFILLSIHWIFCIIRDHFTGRRTYEDLICYSAQIVLGNKYLKSDLLKIHKNFPEPTLLIDDNSANYLVDREIIKEVPDMLTPSMYKAYSLTGIGKDVCRRIFNNK